MDMIELMLLPQRNPTTKIFVSLIQPQEADPFRLKQRGSVVV